MTETGWLKYALIALGGAGGSLLRYGLQGWGHTLTRGPFPIGTLLVNVIGCFAIGALAMLLNGPFPVRVEYRVGLMVGVLGGFTTFSAFGWETFSFLNDRQYWHASMNVILSVGLGLAAVWAGYRLAEKIYGA